MNAEPGGGDSPVPVERRQTDRPKGAVAALIAELRAYQAELESQNKVLRYSQTVAESASERFETLFASVPLALMVVDEYDMVVQANSMAHRSFQPPSATAPLTALMPFVSDTDAPACKRPLRRRAPQGTARVTEVVFTIAPHTRITGDLHIARIEDHQGDGPMQLAVLCAVIDQGPCWPSATRCSKSAATAQRAAARQREAAGSRHQLRARRHHLRGSERPHHRVQPHGGGAVPVQRARRAGQPAGAFLPAAGQALAFAQLTTQAMLGEMTACTPAPKSWRWR